MITLTLARIGSILTPDPDDPREARGVLNPASARSHDGTLYLFPRTVAEGNDSRISMGRVRFNVVGDPSGVQRLGSVLTLPRLGQAASGVEDPRVTYLPLLDRYVMTYTALGRHGPRIALAVSSDLFHWQVLGLVHLGQCQGVDFDRYPNKDGVLFPNPVRDPTGQPAFALLHRPTYLMARRDGCLVTRVPEGITDARPSIWIAYIPLEAVLKDIRNLTRSHATELLAQSHQSWEALKIGAGPPPVLTARGWLLFYHGVSGTPEVASADGKAVCYQVGAMLLARDDPRHILTRTVDPIFGPAAPDEIEGTVPDVVFPTAVDVRGQRLDIYYGAADTRIAVATTRLRVPIEQAPSAPPLSGVSAVAL